MKLKVNEIVGNSAITREEGNIVYRLIHPELITCNHVELDFSDVDIYASPFFNFAIGQLLRDISSEILNKYLKIIHLNDLGTVILRRVIDNAKKTYSDPEYHKVVDNAIKGILEDN